ncbi:hypothetical protein FHX81_0642 [Saccharothrix saharensis]|uniref:DUF6292 domain-containing protein n=1 Tax=Saccharothrix saharensis TaxID=571190 RepID=A0A543J6B1_9PSEU|nr:DUF6292 family protein [Saccharothrix saharensis]TQM78376.1 hypothetical protein FHX81_0642 [Saccharothrix saharensis]
MELDFDDALTWGLRGYVRRVTEELGLTGECSYVQAERPAGAYLALEGRLPGFPDRDVALLWDEERGWSAAVETHSGEDVLVQAHFGSDVVPPPQAVARWARALFLGRVTPEPRSGAPRDRRQDLVSRLAPYTAAALVPVPRGA